MGRRTHDYNGIYTITNLLDKKIYVGESGTIYRRWDKHKTELRKGTHHNSHLQRAWLLIGEDLFKFDKYEIMEDATREERLIREKEVCNLLNTYNENFGYNIHTEDYQSGNRRKQQIAKKPPKKVYQLSSTEGIIVSIWQSKKEIAEHFKIPMKQVEKMMFGTYRGDNETVKTSRGYIWVIEGAYSPSVDYIELCKPNLRTLKEKTPRPKRVYKPKGRKTIPISLQNIETQEIRNFPSKTEACQSLGIDVMGLYNLIKGFKNKGAGKIVTISQWKGWKIHKPESAI